jgi:DNA (cytosine-5)-methyltransferase 1
MQQTKLKVLDLFSGIGGFSLGLESTGHFETIAFCEKDEFCQKVLQKNFKNIPIEGDVRNVKGEKYKADVVVGGFPCQSISIAGKQKGKDDDRFLFPEMLRVIKEVKPRWIIGENVQNLINISNGTILKEIVEGLENEGFEVQCFSISASSQGAWHKRERVWIIASNTNNRLSIGENQEIQTRGNTIDNGSSSNVPNSQCNEHQHTPTRQSGTGELWGFYSEKEKQTSHDLWSKTSRCNAPFRQKSWWQTQSELCRIPHGLSTSMDRNRANRIKALGNSIVPQIARELGKAIIIAEND